jgi:hypothetical protein
MLKFKDGVKGFKWNAEEGYTVKSAFRINFASMRFCTSNASTFLFLLGGIIACVVC